MCNEYEYKIQAILYELEECRADERDSKSQLFQLLAALTTFMTILTAVVDSASPLHKYIFSLVVTTLSAAIAYVVALGYLSTIRHQYIKEMEMKLRLLQGDDEEEHQIYWNSLSSKVITMNIKHISSRYTVFYLINYISAIVFVIFLAIIFAYANYELISDNMKVLDWWCLGGFVLISFLAVFTLIFSTQNSKKILQYLKNEFTNEEIQASKDKKKKRLGYIKSMLYYIYPRPKEVQKNIFLILGFIMISLEHGMNSEKLELKIIFLLGVMFIFDFLIYQVRYHINDLRGLDETSKNTRLPIEELGEYKAIFYSIFSVLLKVLCLLLIILFYPEYNYIIVVSGLSIVALTVAYEYARNIQSDKLVFFLVGFGYPLRVFIGMIAANKNFEYLLTYENVFFLLSFLCFGWSFVFLAWAQEAIYLFMQGETIHKHYLEKIIEALGIEKLGKGIHKYPLRENSKEPHKMFVWDYSYVGSIILISVVIWQMSEGFYNYLAVLATLVLGIVISVVNDGKRIRIFIVMLVGGIIALTINYKEVGFLSLQYSLMLIIQMAYVAIYILFLNTNYEEMYDFGRPFRIFKLWILQKIVKLKKLLLLLLGVIFGKKVLEVIYKHMQDRYKVKKNK